MKQLSPTDQLILACFLFGVGVGSGLTILILALARSSVR